MWEVAIYVYPSIEPAWSDEKRLSATMTGVLRLKPGGRNTVLPRDAALGSIFMKHPLRTPKLPETMSNSNSERPKVVCWSDAFKTSLMES